MAKKDNRHRFDAKPQILPAALAPDTPHVTTLVHVRSPASAAPRAYASLDAATKLQ